MSVNPALGQKINNGSDQQFQTYLSQGAREGMLILTAAVCLFLMMSLVSHYPGDPGWTSTGSNTKPLNYGGVAGAWFADVLLYFVGYVAFLFPIMIGYRACVIFRYRKTEKDFHWPLFSIRVVGLIFTLLGATALLAMYSITGLNDYSGGIVGMEFSTFMLENFNFIGSTLLLVSMLLFGMTVFTGISWIGLMDRTGAATIALANLLGRASKHVWHVYQSRRSLLKDQRAEIQAQLEANKSVEKTKVNPRKYEASITPSVIQHLRTRVGCFVDWLKYRRTQVKTSGVSDSVDETTRIEPGVGVDRSIEYVNEELQVKQVAVSDKQARSEKQLVPAKTPLKISPFEKKGKKSNRVEDEAQGNLFIGQHNPLPPLSLLDPPDRNKKQGYSKEMLEHMSRLLEEKLGDFGVSAEVVEVNPGPVITRFEIQPAPGVKVSKISNLAKDLARSLAVLSVRVVEVIPGKSVVGIEIPNEHREIVRFSEVLQSKDYDDSESPVTLGLGNDIAGDPVVTNLAKMPHLLVAGTTGSGKSVGVNSMILSMLFKATPAEVRFIMIDPKMLELSIYDGIPHLLTPVVTDMKEAANALRWCVAEMERRYKLMAAMGVRNVAGYNRKVKQAIDEGEPLLDPLWQPEEHLLNEEQHQPELESLPFIVVVIDEFADMMMIVGKKVEELIARIAQKARAAGIHLILATQRPSVDVITGLIKANVPTRISFQVSSKIDSRTVLDQGGAEQLLGHGDMLYMPPGTSVPVRVHGAFVDDHEVHKVVADWKQRGEPDYIEEVLTGGESSDPFAAAFDSDSDSEQDALFDEAVAFVTETRRVSISSVQRKLKIGYNRSANLVEAMELAGVVSTAGHNGMREVLAPPPPKD